VRVAAADRLRAINQQGSPSILDTVAREQGDRYNRCGDFDFSEARMPKKKPDPVDILVGNRLRMRRLMLDMSQTEIATAVGVTFQQLQKYEKGANRVSASRLQHLSRLLQVPVPFFFEGLSTPALGAAGAAAEADGALVDVNAFLANSDGLALSKAFMSIPNPRLRRAIVLLVEQITAEDA
jgi:transcriptional regulator with XRE-family HTH domain